ncbi:MAG: hypothetical protein WCK82_08350 [Bacteroidota bacterium]
MTDTKDVAVTILAQLGGNKFKVMTGANLFSTWEDKGNPGLAFKLPSRICNKVIITLLPSDTYQMRFLKIRGVNVKTVREFTDIYADQLQEIFTEVTGLDTHL